MKIHRHSESHHWKEKPSNYCPWYTDDLTDKKS